MKPKIALLFFLIILLGYAFMYFACQPPEKCDDDCKDLSKLSLELNKKFSYFHYSYRCARFAGSDTLCIAVRDVSGINWDLFADTVCMYANSVGLYRQKIFVIKYVLNAADTVARKQCP